MDIFKLGDKILSLLEMVFGFWNNQISLVFAMLGQSPVNFKGGGPWAVIEGIEPIFVAVGSSLVVLFFVIGFCSESVDIREEMRFEVILRMLIRVALAEWFVANNVTIMKAFFTSIGNLVNLLSAGTNTTMTIDSTQADIIKNLGFGESLIMLILAALLSIIIIICGFFMIYTVYFRFLRLLIIVPMGAIAFSTMGGNRTINQTVVSYCKYFLSVTFEAVTMALAIIVCNAFVNAGLPSFTGNYTDWAQTLIYLCEMTFTIALTVGSVKGAQSLTSKAFGL
ncbi:MAG: hypothetical protein PHY47_12460 [Lachnospiraceae bacterium]|nr:hypothetical protein [Lachnospiraceae bacterium]